MNNFESKVLNFLFGLMALIIIPVFFLKKDSVHKLSRIQDHIAVETLLVNMNKQIIELYQKNYNYKINHGLLSRNTSSYLKKIKYVNKITFVMESEELKHQTQSDLIMSKDMNGELTYTNVPNDEQWKMVRYKDWYKNARNSKTPVWSPVYYKKDDESNNFIINYSMPVHNRSEEGGNAFIMNVEIIGKIIRHNY